MNIFELFGTIAINNKDANNALKDTSEKAERTGKQIQEAFKKVGSATVKVGKTIIGGATAVATAFAATVESSRDYRTAMAQLDTAFTTNGHTAETALKTYKDLQSVMGDTDAAVEAATALALMCDKEEDLAKWVDICTGAWAEHQGKLPIEGLAEAANETAKVGVVTGNLADALNWVGISEDDFNLKLRACTTEEERQSLIMNTLFNQYKASAEQYKVTGENVMKANAAQENLNSALAKLGEIGEPIITGVKNWIADMVNAAAPHLQTLIDKLVNFDTTMETEVWPWIQQEAKMKFGVDLPDWETFKGNVEVWWADTKTNISTTIEKTGFLIKCMGFGEWTEEDTDRLRAWWDGVYAKCVEICKWILDPPELPSPDEMVSNITSWWNSVKSQLSLTFGVKPQVYASDVQGVSTGSSAADAYIQATTVNPDAPWASALQNLFRPNSSNAVGLDRVPRDGYLIRAHKDETLLNKEEADARRSGFDVDALANRFASSVISAMSGMAITLDKGATVGQLLPAIDAGLGTIGNRKGRGN